MTKIGLAFRIMIGMTPGVTSSVNLSNDVPSHVTRRQGTRDSIISWGLSSHLSGSLISPFQRGDKVRVDGTPPLALWTPLWPRLCPHAIKTVPLPPHPRTICLSISYGTDGLLWTYFGDRSADSVEQQWIPFQGDQRLSVFVLF